MSLDTYANLKTAIANTLRRSDLTSIIPDFISLAEDRMNKRLRLRGMEIRSQSSVNTEYATLPSRFLAIKNIQVNTTPRTSLKFATPDYLDMKYPDSTFTAIPQFYTLIAGQIQFAPVPDTTYTVEMDYYQKLDIASDSTNWVLTNAPRLYYYGSLLEAALYLKDTQRAQLWEKLYETALDDVQTADAYDQVPDESLSIRSEYAL